ncbi:MAG: glucosaminidase domain-containing protein [Bacteroidia bacterium]|nr:glucosaminidase domain-containing protein [Bacteroidia bacterium]
MKRFALLIIMICLILSCGSRKKIVTKKSEVKKPTEVIVKKDPKTDELSKESKTNSPKSNSTEAYISKYKNIAVSEMNTYGIPASITLAQGILESGSGKGRLAKEANNHFGIKCHNWKGDKIYHDDDRSQECFRKYKDASTSFRDHSEFLAKRKRYANLFKLRRNDYKGWAKELRRAGYATDKKYPQKLISIIERYELFKYDNEVAISEAIPIPDEHIVVKGDTLYSISKRYNLPLNYLKQLNGLQDSEIQIGQVLYLKSRE